MPGAHGEGDQAGDVPCPERSKFRSRSSTGQGSGRSSPPRRMVRKRGKRAVRSHPAEMVLAATLVPS